MDKKNMHDFTCGWFIFLENFLLGFDVILCLNDTCTRCVDL
jgi:hypothetical protein